MKQVEGEWEDSSNKIPIIETDFMENLFHGMRVSKLAYALAI